ncbi:MAG: pyridoxal-phosphate dependent enzyme [Sandaracinaceae bacterium]
MSDRPLWTAFPVLEERVPWARLGAFPTRVDCVSGLPGALYVKRDDLSSPRYGGNKVRTLEVLFGRAKALGAARIYATGAYGSNHATATVRLAPEVGLEPGVMLFPQPRSATALENLRVMLAARPVTRDLPHWSFLPWAMQKTGFLEADRSFVMVPGGATPTGALGYVNAALELAGQVDRGELPCPETIVVGIGSTCTSAGLLLGLRVAAERGLGWERPPRLVSARVTPWPVTAKWRVVSLARQAGARLAKLTGERRWGALPDLGRDLEVDGRYLGWGYGIATPRGRETITTWRDTAGFELDTTYSAKAAACAIDRASQSAGPVLFWSTKSTAVLPEVTDEDVAWAPPRMQRWMRRAAVT